MLDDLKYIHEKDAQDALGIAAKQPEQLLHTFDLGAWAPASGTFDNVVYAGMGGSSLAASISTSWPGYKVPFEICRQYNIPGYVSKRTLFIASSYSGNTEETLSAIAQAEAKKATIVVIAGGGALKELAEKNGYTFLLIPKAEQPRYAVFYNLSAVYQLLSKTDLLLETVTPEILQTTTKFLQDSTQGFLPTVPTKENYAKALAQEMMGKSAVVYSGPFLAPVAYKWKISFNENAKNVAWQGVLPEFSHNEFIGWSSHPTAKPYAIIDLESSYEHPQIKKRFEVSTRLLSGKRPNPNNIEAKGSTKLEQLLWTTMLGDFTTIYLGLLNGVNPTPVDLVEKMKKELA